MLRLLVFLVVIGAAALGGIFFYSNSLIKEAVVTYGPDAVNVPVGLDDVSLSPFSGSGSIKGLTLGQPKGFGDGSLFSVDAVRMTVDINTLLDDHVIVDELIIEDLFVAAKLVGAETNFQRFMKNLPVTDSSADAENISPDNTGSDAAEPLTLTIKKLVIQSPSMTLEADGLMAEKTIDLASFELTDLGTDEKGLRPAEIARHVADTLKPQIAKAVASQQFKGTIEKVKDKAKSGLKSIADGLFNKQNKKK